MPKTGDMIKSSKVLEQIIVEVRPQLLGFSEQEVQSKPAPDKWNKKQILGHLVDSGLNNIGRFIRAQKSEDLIFDGYDQEFWVEAQGYENEELGYFGDFVCVVEFANSKNGGYDSRFYTIKT